MLKKKYPIILFLVLALIIRIYYINLPVAFSIREGDNGLAAWRIVNGELMYRDFYHSQTPIFAYIVAIVFGVFGVGLTQGRILSAAFAGLTLLVIYYNGKKNDEKTGLLGGLIFVLAPVTIKYGVMILTDLLAITFCLIGYYFLNESHKGDTRNQKIVREEAESSNIREMILAGLFVGLGILTKLVMAPILLAFIVIILVEGFITHSRIKKLMIKIGLLLIGVVLSIGIVLPYFLLMAREQFFFMILGQHLDKPYRSWLARLAEPVIRFIQADLLFVIFFLISLPYALKKRYGRGLFICIVFMVVSVVLMVPWPNSNYYEINFPIMVMICGMFPLSSSILKDFQNLLRRIRPPRKEMIKGVVIGGFLIYLMISPLLLSTPVEQEFKISNQTIHLTFQSHLIEMNDTPKLTVDWIKANTDPNEYILSDQSVINLMAERRGPFAEISVDRMRVGQMNSTKLITAVQEYNIRVVVVTGRAFGQYEAYDEFMVFLEENFDPIEVGYTIYVREMNSQV